MKLLVHDLEPEAFRKHFPDISGDIKIISDNGTIHPCMGCFGCWVKTPGRCVMKDGFEDLGALLSKAEEFIIISRCFYGTYSPFIRNVWDRCMPYLLPYFTKREGRAHHKLRYPDHGLKLRALFYGEDITENEKETARELAAANGVNFDAVSVSVGFYTDLSKLQEEARGLIGDMPPVQIGGGR